MSDFTPSTSLRDARPELPSDRVKLENAISQEKHYYNIKDKVDRLQTNTTYLSAHTEKRIEVHNPPLQFHQVLPTFHGPENHYRTAATSPFQSSNSGENMNESVITSRGSITLIRSTPTSFQTSDLIVPQMSSSMPVLKSSSPINPTGCSDEMQRIYTKDEYESEDELRREDISFNADGGERNCPCPCPATELFHIFASNTLSISFFKANF